MDQTKLKARLDAAQKTLADCYAHYALKEEVKALQDEIPDVQGQLLHTRCHAMQKELRAIVGPERFLILSKRIDNAIRNPPPEPSKK